MQPHQGQVRSQKVHPISEAANESRCPALRPGVGSSETAPATLKGAQTDESLQRSEYQS